MYLTIERIRTLVLVAGVLLLAALGVFLTASRWKNRLIRHDLPQRLAKEILQESNGFKYVHTFGAHMQYEIDASRQVQLKDNRIMLHEVRIKLYGTDGNLMDEIDGDTFEYDQKTHLAIAEGPVEMVLTQPQKAGTKGTGTQAKQIQVKTSGVTFDQQTGMVTTAQRVDFSMMEGSGTAVGAIYDSQSGYLTLDESVELTTERDGDVVTVHAQHAEFSRGAGTCWMRQATAEERGSKAQVAEAKILFREDGSASRLEATGGFVLATATGGHIAAPTGSMDFDAKSQPQHGHMEGGVTMDSVKNGRTVHGTAPTAELVMAGKGQLRHAHLERGVAFTSEEMSQDSNGQGTALRLNRSWRSQVADIDFRDAGNGQVEPEHLDGTGSVVITSESRRGDAPMAPSKMSADHVTGEFGPDSALQTITGVGHAAIEETSATGTRQTANGDRLQASFAPPDAAQNRGQGSGVRDRKDGEQGNKGTSDEQAAQVQSAELNGHVVLFQQLAAKPGAQPRPPVHATAGKAVYEGSGEWLHLTESPRVQNGGLEMTADKVDFSQQTDEAFVHGNVKATWSGNGNAAGTPSKQNAGSAASSGGTTFGGNGPAHVIANEAQVNESTGEATFRENARLWQQANSVAGPQIVLNRHLQTLEARSTDPAEPVRAVLLSASKPSGTTNKNAGRQPQAPSVIRIHGGDLWYSDAERRALMHRGAFDAVVADTGTATSSSDTVELRLLPAGNHEGNSGAQGEVDQMTASGHVVLNSQGRRGTGEQLVYTGATGEYALTGTAAAPPKMSDPQRGTVTGETLIFDSRDDSVSIEGGGHETRTDTTAPDAHGK